MKGKVIRGRCIRWLLKYVLGLDKTKKNANARTIGGNLAETTVKGLSKCFNKVSKIRGKKCSRPFLHIPLRMPKGEDVSDQMWVDIAKALMKKMEISFDRPWILVKHDHEHVHLVTSRVDYNGQLWHGRWEALELIKATHELEKEFGLTQTPTLDTAEWNKTRLTSGEIIQIKEHTDAGTEPEALPRQQLADLISDAIDMAQGSFQRFKSRLAAGNVSVLLNKSKSTSHVSGISFGLNGFTAKGSKVARAYSWRGIVARLKEQKRVLNQSVPVTAKDLSASVVAESKPEVSPETLNKPPQPEPGLVARELESPIVPSENLEPVVPTVIISAPEIIKPAIGIQPDRDFHVAQVDIKLWRHDPARWESIRKILVETYCLDPRMVDFLHDNQKLWAVEGNALVAARHSIPDDKRCSLSRLQLGTDALNPTVLAPERPGLFNIVNRFHLENRIIVTANAIEAISYYQLSHARHPDCPRGFVVSADNDLPPGWLVDLAMRQKKQLLLATKTKKNADEICVALPQLLVQGRLAPWFEMDVSNCESWNQLLKERPLVMARRSITGIPNEEKGRGYE